MISALYQREMTAGASGAGLSGTSPRDQRRRAPLQKLLQRERKHAKYGTRTAPVALYHVIDASVDISYAGAVV